MSKQSLEVPDELYYLDENFSVRSLRKFQLKEILSAHDIPYLRNITRADLINLFKKHIEPRREELIRAYKAKMPEKSDKPEDQELGRGHRATHKPVKFEEEIIQPARKSTSSNKKDKDGFAIPSLPTNRVVIEAQPVFHAEDSFAEESDSQSATESKHSKRELKSALTNRAQKILPKPFTEAAAPKKSVRFKSPTFDAEDSFASSDDEGQPLVRERVPRKRSPPKVQQKPEYTLQDIRPAALKVKTSTLKPDKENDDSDYNADSDDTVEYEELEDLSDDGEDAVDELELVQLYKEQHQPLEELIKPVIMTRAQRIAAAKRQMLAWRAKLRKTALVFCSIYMFVGVIGFLFTSYARNQNGYCQNYPPNESNKEVPFIFSLLPSSCIPCPSHGICTNGDLKCDTLYERKTPFYNIKHILPIADECIHDSFLGGYVSSMEKQIKNALSRKQGEAVCSYLTSHPESKPTDVPILKVPVKDVMTDIKARLESKFSVEQLDEIMLAAISSVLEDPQVHYWEGEEECYFGTNHIKYSIGCQLKRIYINTPTNVKLYIILFLSIISAVYGTSRDYRKNKLAKERIANLVRKIVDQLRVQHEKHLAEASENPSVSVSQIRSSILDVNDPKTLEVWQKVVQEVYIHPHIRRSFQEIRGDPVEFWELTP